MKVGSFQVSVFIGHTAGRMPLLSETRAPDFNAPFNFCFPLRAYSILKCMDAERARAFLLSLPYVVETVSETARWGDKLVFRVGDQAAGGKMFSQIDLEKDGRAILSFAADPGRFHEFLEREGVIPAPYRARLHWIALLRWDVVRDSELKDLLCTARALTFAKLPKRTRDLLTTSS
jgi:predicted DNA-binding protein (MmcQ/YjbR family)